jgi:glycosyltransferase involved in cell wall biosynthesis
LRVLALASYPVEAAATRFRVDQYVGPLADCGIVLEVRPFLTSAQFARFYQRRSPATACARLIGPALRRLRDVASSGGFDAVLVQREAMLFGPPVVEYLLTRARGLPMVLDLDDATYLPYTSPTYGKIANVFKCFGKTDDLIRWSRVVTCGNRSIAAHAGALGARAVLVPTVVDTDRFCPRPATDPSEPPLLGWVGSHSTFPYLETIFPALGRLARVERFRLRVVGSGRDAVRIAGVDVECLPWSLGREAEDFRSLDVGLYPVGGGEWAAGKSGLKAVQYLAVGIPFVVSPVGACAEIGRPGVTHFEATTQDEWFEALRALLTDSERARRMGREGRAFALEHYTIEAQAEKLAGAIRLAVGDVDASRVEPSG